MWTLEKQGKKVEATTRFEDATPTLTHKALVRLVERGVVKCIVSQNVDGLHLKSGLPRYIHGNPSNLDTIGIVSVSVLASCLVDVLGGGKCNEVSVLGVSLKYCSTGNADRIF